MAKKETTEQQGEVRESGIVVNDAPLSVIRQVPLIITLPEGASEAQIERAKVLNAYAVSYPEKWEDRKEYLLKELEGLKNAPAPRSNPNVRLSVGPKAPENI